MHKKLLLLATLQTAFNIFSMDLISTKKNSYSFDRVSDEIFYKHITQHPNHNELKKALELFEENKTKYDLKFLAQSEKPNPLAQALLAEIYQKEEKFEKAKMYFSFSSLPNTKVDLGDLYWKEGKKKEALNAYQKGCHPIRIKSNDSNDYFYFHDAAFIRLQEISSYYKSNDYHDLLEKLYKQGADLLNKNNIHDSFAYLSQAADKGHENAKLLLTKTLFKSKDREHKKYAFGTFCSMLQENNQKYSNDILNFLKKNNSDLQATQKLLEMIKDFNDPNAAYLSAFLCYQHLDFNNKDLDKLKKDLAQAEQFICKAEKLDTSFSKKPYTIKIRIALINMHIQKKKYGSAELLIHKLPDGYRHNLQSLLGYYVLPIDLKKATELFEKGAEKDCNALLKLVDIFLYDNHYEGSMTKEQMICQLNNYIQSSEITEPQKLFLQSQIVDLNGEKFSIDTEILKNKLLDRLNKNDCEAYYTLGIAHYLSKNYQEAFEYFSKANTLGCLKACGYIGGMIAVGQGTKQSFCQAIEYLKKATSNQLQKVYEYDQDLINTLSFSFLDEMQNALLKVDFNLENYRILNHIFMYKLEHYEKVKDINFLLTALKILEQTMIRLDTHSKFYQENLVILKNQLEQLKKFEKTTYRIPFFIGKIYAECLIKNIKLIDKKKKKSNTKDYLTKIDAYWQNCLSITNLDDKELVKRADLLAYNYFLLAQNLDSKNISLDKADEYYKKSLNLCSTLQTANAYTNFCFNNNKENSERLLKNNGKDIPHLLISLGDLYQHGKSFKTCHVLANKQLALQYYNDAYNNPNATKSVKFTAGFRLADIYNDENVATQNKKYYEKIGKIYAQLEELDAHNINLIKRKAELLMYNGKDEAALQEFEKIPQEEIDPYLDRTLLQIILYLSCKKIKKGLTSYEKCLIDTHNKKNIDALDLIVRYGVPRYINIFNSLAQAHLLTRYLLYLSKEHQLLDVKAIKNNLSNIETLLQDSDPSISKTALIVNLADEIRFPEKSLKLSDKLNTIIEKINQLKIGNTFYKNEIIRLCLDDISEHLEIAYQEEKVTEQDLLKFTEFLQSTSILN